MVVLLGQGKWIFRIEVSRGCLGGVWGWRCRVMWMAIMFVGDKRGGFSTGVSTRSG